MKIGTVVVSYNRPELLAATVESYCATVTGDYELVVVDNGSDRPTVRWLEQSGLCVIYLPRNRYPGPAANVGWQALVERFSPELLHRSDNDVRYLDGWADTVRATLDAHPDWGQISMRTDDEELHQDAVGGNSVIRRAVWDAGIRYAEEGWDRVPWEDGALNMRIRRSGFAWGRVPTPCIVHEGALRPEHKTDPYYVETYRVRRIPHLLRNA